MVGPDGNPSLADIHHNSDSDAENRYTSSPSIFNYQNKLNPLHPFFFLGTPLAWMSTRDRKQYWRSPRKPSAGDLPQFLSNSNAAGFCWNRFGNLREFLRMTAYLQEAKLESARENHREGSPPRRFGCQQRGNIESHRKTASSSEGADRRSRGSQRSLRILPKTALLLCTADSCQTTGC